MKQVSKLAKAMQVLVVSLLVSMALVQGVYGIEVRASGSSNGESGSVAFNFDLAKDATVNSKLTIAGASIAPTTAISGSISKFEQTHAVKDSTGKSASVSVKVVNAPNGLTYESYVLPGEGAVTAQPWVSAEQWLTVPKADSVEATASASYGSLSVDASIGEFKGSVAGDYVTLTGYDGIAYASDKLASAQQTATGGSGNSVNIFNHARDGVGLSSVETKLNGIASGTAKFQGLNSLSSAGSSNQATQKEHIQGTFTSTATYRPATGTSTSKTRTSNYGREFDLNMQALKGSLPSGIVGYYVAPGMATLKLGAIQGAVNAAQSGDAIYATAGTYAENVAIDKSLNIIGYGDSDTIVDGRKAGSVFTVGKVNPNVDVTLSSMTIQNGAAVNGAGIRNMGRTTVLDSTLSGNIASYSGGGIYNKGTLNLVSSSILANEAKSSTDYKYGGGIWNEGTLAIADSTISGNKAKFGGGIYNYLGTTSISGSGISGNTASWQGGAIANEAILNVKSSTFSGNNAQESGGAINNAANGRLTLASDTFIGNKAYYGGGIFSAPGSEMTVDRSIFMTNSAKYGAGLKNDGVAVVSNSSFINNVANDGAGLGSDGEMLLKDCIIAHNIANFDQANGGRPLQVIESQGAGVINEGNMRILRSQIFDNHALGGSGGGICNFANMVLSDSNIYGNTARTGGGVASGLRSVGNGEPGMGVLTITNTNIYGNTAVNTGGGISNYGILNLESGSIDHNLAGTDGGGIRNYQGVVNFKGTYPVISIANNVASNSGGGISKYQGIVNGLPSPWYPIVQKNTPNT